MNGKTDKKVEIRKNWVAPELKKVDIELITAGGGPRNSNDGFSSQSPAS
jgi:hypothetical protein